MEKETKAKKKQEEQQPDTDKIVVQQYANSWGQDEADGIADVLDSGPLVEGPKNREFEQKFAKFVGAKYCVLMPNPTLALYAAIIATKPRYATNGIRIPDFGYIEVFDATIMANMLPVLCDVNDRGTLELRDQEDGIGVHFNGRLSKANNIEICFDAIDVHTKDLVSVYDFNYHRHLTLGGKGGAICTDDPEVYNTLLRLKDHGRLEIGGVDYNLWGIDLQVTEFQAAYGLAQLPGLEKKIERVREIYEKIKESLKDTKEVVFLKEPPSMYIDIYTKHPIELGKFLAEHGIMANRLPKPLHMQNVCKYAHRVDTKFTFSNTLYNAGIFLPSSPIMEDSQVDYMIEILKKFVSSKIDLI